MGRGDKKTRKGKIFRASFGNSRPKAKRLAPAKTTATKSASTAKKKTVAKKK